MIEFALLAILGVMVFWVPVSAQGRIVLLVIFVVLMVLVALQGFGVIPIPHLSGGKW